MTPELKTKLESIRPGFNYPRFVKITETVEGKPVELLFTLQSYCVGMYCAIAFPGSSLPHQTGDHNNRSFVAKLKRDIKKAIERGAAVEIGNIQPVKESP